MTKNHSTQIKSLFESAGINVSNVCVLGRYVHIDTYQKYEQKILQLLTSMGAIETKTLTPGKDGAHLDGKKCFRIVCKL